MTDSLLVFLTILLVMCCGISRGAEITCFPPLSATIHYRISLKDIIFDQYDYGFTIVNKYLGSEVFVSLPCIIESKDGNN